MDGRGRMCSNYKTVVFYFYLLISFGVASYHEQYRVPEACNEKFESYVFKDREFLIQNLAVSWEYAKILCRGHHNGTIAVLDTREKAEFLAEALSESQFSAVGSIWVGARRNSAEDPQGYRWTNGLELRRTELDVLGGEEDRELKEQGKHYPMWLNRTHIPVPEGGADCVAVERVHHDKPVFVDLPCNLERPFVCERDARLHVEVIELKTVRCRTGLYHVYDGRMDWHQAAAYCVMKKMTLANIATMKCLKKLGMTMLKSRPSIENAWVGARGNLGKWHWLDTGASIFQVAPYTDVKAAAWPPMRDRTTIKQSGCLQLDRHSSHPPIFMEARCERKMQFICYEVSTVAPAIRTSPTPPSDENYYYILVRQQLYWQHAFENCQKMNGTMASVDNNEILIQLLLVMGENKDEPIDHIWISGRLNMTKDINSDTVFYTWYNPISGKKIADPKNYAEGAVGVYIAPWLDEDFTMDSPCLNLDRQDHLGGLVYGLPCDTPQYSICMIEKAGKSAPTSVIIASEPTVAVAERTYTESAEPMRK